MDIETFTNIMAIAEEKSISKAASRLFVSRTALNRQLLAVEKELGLPLFKRVSNTLELTYAGEVFIQTAETIWGAIKDCNRLMNDITGNIRGRISIGITSGRATIMLKDIITRFSSIYPLVSLSFRIANSDELRELLYMGKIDISLIASSELSPDFTFESLSNEEIVLICSNKHPLAHLASIDEYGNRSQCRMEWFKHDVFGFEARGTPMRVLAERIFAEQDFEPETIIENCTIPLLMQLAAEGVCCTFFSERHLEQYENVVGFSFEPRRHFTLSLAYRKDFIPNIAEECFMNLLREFYSS